MLSGREYLRILLVILVHIGLSLTERIGCKDEKGKDVDWFINYKIPKIKEESDEDLADGVGYAYILAPGSSKWTLSTKTIASGSMIEETLSTYYENKKDLTYLFYNDDPPGKKSGSAAGHLKGVLVFDDKTGFWLIHSIPNFPDHRMYKYPESAQNYGQTAICITFKTSKLVEIAKQLLYNNPKIYAKAITEDVEDQLDDNARSLFSNKPEFVKKAPFTRKAELTSLGGVKFFSFAKDNQLQKDLYSDIIAPDLKTSLLVETWRKGAGGLMDKECSLDYDVIDVYSINMTFSNKKKKVHFEYTQDHSKWAISDEEDNNYICIADLNRMVSQEKRGGGAICFQSTRVVTAFESIIAKNDICPKKRGK